MVKPINPDGDFRNSESEICLNLSKSFVLPLILNQPEVKITRQKGEGFLFSIFSFFILPPLSCICFVNIQFLLQKNVNDLSYWGQKIQILSSCSHPPTSKHIYLI